MGWFVLITIITLLYLLLCHLSKKLIDSIPEAEHQCDNEDNT